MWGKQEHDGGNGPERIDDGRETARFKGTSRSVDGPPCISEFAVVQLRVAAGVSPAVESRRLARRTPRAKSERALNLVAGSGRSRGRGTALYGRRDACRYRRIGDVPDGPRPQQRRRSERFGVFPFPTSRLMRQGTSGGPSQQQRLFSNRAFVVTSF